MTAIIVILVTLAVAICVAWLMAIIVYIGAKSYSTSVKLRYKDFRALYATAPDKWKFDSENATYRADRIYYIYFSPFEWLTCYIPFYINYNRGKTNIQEADTLEGFLVSVQKDINAFRDKGIDIIKKAEDPIKPGAGGSGGGCCGIFCGYPSIYPCYREEGRKDT